jgi:NAD(P)-dependent dehydrogenase (short-subunit alcohol dehydrogenase family)
LHCLNFFIVGGNNGIGKETAKDLCSRGARVIMLCRSMEKAEEACQEITKEIGKTVEYQKLDLSSLESMRDCAHKLLVQEEKIDILVNNAGVMACLNCKTKDGFDMQLGTNHLGHFLL